jgi:cytidine deaminase
MAKVLSCAAVVACSDIDIAIGLLVWLQVHGEQFLMANLLLHKERSLHSLAISAAPCGHCRQFYSELACAVSTACQECIGRKNQRAKPVMQVNFWSCLPHCAT